MGGLIDFWKKFVWVKVVGIYVGVSFHAMHCTLRKWVFDVQVWSVFTRATSQGPSGAGT
jgi:hypothetical protein